MLRRGERARTHGQGDVSFDDNINREGKRKNERNERILPRT